MTYYNRNPHVDVAVLRVTYDSHRKNWNVITDHVAPGGVLSQHETKKSALKEARKVAKSNSVRPSKIIIENKGWSSVEDQKTLRYE